MAVTQGLGDGYALYNGVKLPNIESVWTDKETRPCALITFESNTYWLMIAKTMTGTYDGIYKRAEVSYTTYIQYVLPTDNPTYWKKTGSGDSASGIMSSMNPIWANTTIINAQSGATFISATDPIPLDGMQVIEWDGDMTGLTATAGGYAMIADFANAGSAICSVTGGGETAVADDFQKDTVGDGIVWNVKVSGSDFNVVSASSVEYEISGNTVPAGIGVIIAGPGTYILAYTPAAEPETPKWQFNLRDFLSGIAAAAASRGVIRRTPIAYLYNGVQLPGLPEVEGYPKKAIVYNTSPFSQYGYWFIAWDADTVKTAGPAENPIFTEAKTSPVQFKLTNDVWVENTMASNAISTLKWCNHDIYATATGELSMSASEPIPVYE